MKKNSLLFISLLLMTGCTTSMKPVDQVASKIEQIDEKNYTIGKQQKVYVGEQVISRKAYKAIIKNNLFKALNDFSLSGGISLTYINLSAIAGDTFRVAGVNENNNPVLEIPRSNFMFGINDQGQWDKTVMSSTFWNSPVGSGGQYTMTPENTTFQKVDSSTPYSEEGYINHEIVFTGLGANGISLLYREYTFENMARSDFKQELVYPLDSKEIRFRNYLLKIHHVDSSEIQFTVVKD